MAGFVTEQRDIVSRKQVNFFFGRCHAFNAVSTTIPVISVVKVEEREVTKISEWLHITRGMVEI